MSFWLIYEGELPSAQNGNKETQHEIRKSFHEQIAILLETPSFEQYKKEKDNPNSMFGFEKRIKERKNKEGKSIKFYPIVFEDLEVAVDLKILLLLPPKVLEPVYSVYMAGDLDNRIKTLCDALSIPQQDNQIPEDVSKDPSPFYCLMEDDKLIGGLNVTTGTLLEKNSDLKNYAKAIIQVRLIPRRVTMANLGHLF